MLYFPILEGRFPEWLPYWGGESFIFFRPVFNIADSAISIGVGMIILFQKRYFLKPRLERELKMVSPDAETPMESIRLGHEWLVNKFREESIPLDYSAASVEAIEKVLATETTKGLPNKKSWLKEEYGRYLFGIAAYLGEVVIRDVGGLRWNVPAEPESPERSIEVVSEAVTDKKMYPGEKVFKRLHKGKAENLQEYVNYAIKEVFASQSTSSE